MYRLYDLKCTNGHVFEKLIHTDNADDDYKCECGAVARRAISPAKIKANGCDPDNTRAYLKWEKDRNKQIAWEKSRSYYEGD